MKEDTDQLRKKLRGLRIMTLLSMLLSLGLGSYIIIPELSGPEILRSRGLIIQDDEGRDRILIGAPAPFSPDRVRTDSARAWETYVERWPENRRQQVWEWYKDYNHSCNGIIFLSESGYDRIAIGDPTPDPSIGKRIAPGTGINIFDENGDERGGYGIMKFDEDHYRVVLGLDSDSGNEGLALMVDDQGVNGLFVPGSDRNIFLGNTDTIFYATAPYDKFNGLIIKEKDSVAAVLK